MRVLRFIVNGQTLDKQGGDFDGLVAGTAGYLQARFAFNADWSACKKVASFYDALDREYAAPIIDNVCEIPPEALAYGIFSVRVTGDRSGYRIRTNKVFIHQEV